MRVRMLLASERFTEIVDRWLSKEAFPSNHCGPASCFDAGPTRSGSLELLREDRKLADALARQHVDRVAHCRCDRWYTRLARATDEIARLQHVHLDRRRLVDAEHRVVIEVGLD